METVLKVTAWAQDTFGDATIQRQFERALEEMRELDSALLARLPNSKIAEEAADVVICLYRIIGRLDPDAIEKKMKVNRARKWKVDGEGCAYHE